MTQPRHLNRALLDAYFAGQASEYDLVGEVARVLERDCEVCESGLAPARIDYDRALRAANRRIRAELADLDEERRRVRGLLHELAGLTEPETLLRVAGDGRFHTVALVEYELGAAWAGLEGEAWQAARHAVELGTVAVVRLDTGRYGKVGVSCLRAEAELARARVAVAQGRDPEARRALEGAGEWVGSSLSEEAHAGLLLGQAVLALREGDERGAGNELAAAEEICRRGGAARRRVSIETLLAALARRAGRPEAAADRLRGSLGSIELGSGGGVRWRAAYELVVALLESSEVEEALGFVSAWEGELEGRGAAEARVSAGAAELAHLRGLVLRALRRPERGEAALRWAFCLHVTLGRGLRALAVAADLARGTVARSGSAGSLEWLGRALEGVVARTELAGEPLEALARFSGSLWRGTLRGEEVDDFEERISRGDPPWGLDHDEPR